MKNEAVITPDGEDIDLQEASPGPVAARKQFSWGRMFKTGFSIALVAFLLHAIGIENTFARLSKANFWYVPLGVALYLFSQVISSYRWQFLSRALDFKLSLREFYDYYLIGMFCNMFLPGAIGGDAVRMYFLAKSCNRRKREALLTLLAERGVGLVALLLLTSIVSLTPPMLAMNLAIPLKIPFTAHVLHFDLRVILLGLSAFMLAGYLALWVAPLERLAGKIPKLALLLQARVYWARLGLLTKSVSISLVVHSLMVLMHLLVASALGVHVPVLFITVVYGVVSLASVLPIAANGFGVREGAYVLLLTKIGLNQETALAFAFYWVLISTVTSLFGGLVLMKGHYKTPTEQETEVSDL